MMLETKKQSQEVSVSQKPSKAGRQTPASMAQLTFDLIEGPVMDWSVDNSLYSIFETWKVKYDNILQVQVGS